MKLYPKKLRNIDDLEREKERLLKEKQALENEQFFSINGISGSKKAEGKESEGLASLLEFLPVSNPLVSTVVKMVQSVFSKKDKETSAPGKKEHAHAKPGKNILTSVATEFIGGYLKWKAIELSYKAIRHIIRNRKP